MSVNQEVAFELVRQFGAVLEHGRIEELEAILAPDCRDESPMAFQGPGRDGVALRIAWYRAIAPGARTRFLRLRAEENVVLADWITELADGVRSFHRGSFAIEGGRIISFSTGERADVIDAD